MLTLRKAGRSANLSTGFLTGAANERYVGNGTVLATLPLHEAKKKRKKRWGFGDVGAVRGRGGELPLAVVFGGHGHGRGAWKQSAEEKPGDAEI
jgi:hypothetical protein